VALLVRPPHVAKVGGEGEVRLQTQELLVEVPLVGPGEAGHGELAVVVADAAGHAAAEGEGAGVAGGEGFQAFRREQAAEAGVAVRQCQDEQGSLAAGTGHNHLGVSEITPGFARRMQQGNEDLCLGVLGGGDGGADDAGATGVVVLVAQAFVDASGGVPLLEWGEAVVVEELLDDGQEGAEDGLGP
jgi:hypothetical protein